MTEAERLRAQAERCKRLALFITDQATVGNSLGFGGR